MVTVKDPNIFSTVQKYALIFGINSFLALQAMKYELFSFPVIEFAENCRVDVRMVLVYSFSLISVTCIFISGVDLFNKLQKHRNILGQLKEQIEKEDKKEVNQ